MAAIAHGAVRATSDLDCLARRSRENLERLAAAMRELNARLRVEGLSDEEAALLPTPLDSDTLGRMEISTWRTNGGDLDVLTDIPARDGHRLRYEDVIQRAAVQEVHGIAVRVAALEDVIASKEWADRPKDHEALPELRELAARRD
ncbi:MAG: nucleotidyl transferase AbiEii/AbiGii toxin family protein [Actinomycetota bacterium]|nr:nucleotidyl transferase AbiEii/AbiGii toxin family protein [Actinomycetota bacterium]